MDVSHDSFVRAFAAWYHDGLTPLTLVRGYTSLLMDGFFGPISEEQRAVLLQIQQAGHETANTWRYASLYLTLVDTTYHPTWEALDLQQMIQEERLHMSRLEHRAPLVLDIPANLPPIHADSSLRMVLRTFLIPSVLLRKTDVPLSFHAIPTHNGLTLQIHGDYWRSSTFPEQEQYPGTPLHSVQRILRMHHTTLQMDIQDNHVQFTFPVQYWQGS